ncbi:MAG: glycosyltransferase family 2 protein [Acidobacteria bacterium]|nr:glycosyltransferase family 2 protein [Acidobacteriota bacterium]
MEKELERNGSGPCESPAISVIIPVHNGVRMLERCLEALSASLPVNHECIVVDDGSAEEVTHLAEHFGTRYVRVTGGPLGPAHARNAGAAAAKGAILFFIDADVVVRPDTLAKVAESLDGRQGIAAVFGSYDDSPATPDFISQFKNLFHHFVHQHGSEQAATFWSGCGAVRRDVFLEAGGFDDSRYARPCIEDIELGYRLRAAGHSILLDKSIQVKHLKKWTLSGMIKSDVFDRGIPWTLLILDRRHVPNDLNLRLTERLSAILLCAIMLDLGLLPFYHEMTAWPAVVGVCLIVLLNYRLYAFFARRRGIAFTFAALPMHLLYYLSSVFALIAGTGYYVLGGRMRRVA